MKRYLIIEHISRGTHTINKLTKEDLAYLKRGMIEQIFDLEEDTYFDVEVNKWKKVKDF